MSPHHFPMSSTHLEIGQIASQLPELLAMLFLRLSQQGAVGGDGPGAMGEGIQVLKNRDDNHRCFIDFSWNFEF